ncbi:hypothetical protein NMG60_11020427 [Bertholletia excelsa]
MPPEPLPWDRKDLSRERKYERSSEPVGSLAKWRENAYHGSRESSRWGSAEFRGRPPGHGKQDNWQLHSEESGYGFSPSRSNERILDDESCWPSGSRADGKYGRNSRENRDSFIQKDWRGNSWQNVASLNGHGKQLDASDQRLAESMLTYKSPPESDSVNASNQFHLKGQHDNTGSVNGLGTGQRLERENSLGSIDWKPIKWTRSGSLSSRSSGFSHSSSSKNIGVDFSEAKAEVLVKNVTPGDSPSGETVGFPLSVASSDETGSRKKPRLKWGEGLAKYEKKKVESPDDCASKLGLTVYVNSEPSHSHVSNLLDKSPRITGLWDCASPATPSSASPGVEEQPLVKMANVDYGTNSFSGSPSLFPYSPVEGMSSSLESCELISVANLSSSLNELLQSGDLASVDSSFAKPAVMNKLLVWKGEILKALEMTESEIDSLENELKSLISSASSRSCAASINLQGESKPKDFEELAVTSNVIPGPSALQVVASGNMNLEKASGNLEEESGKEAYEALDSPVTMATIIVESSAKDTVLPEPVKDNRSDVLDSSISKDQVVKCAMYGLNEEKMEAVAEFDDEPTVNKSCSIAPVGVLHSDGEDMLHDVIMASNKESANRASEVFNKLLLPNQCQIDGLRMPSFSSWQSNPLITEKFVRRKSFLRFKERIIALKFRAFQQLWKEDMRLLSVKKYRSKSQRRSELNSRILHGYQKHRSSIRSRLSPAGIFALVPTSEIVNFTSKLISDSQVKLYRNSLKMPALILDEKEKAISRFMSSNGLVEDPCAVEKERAMINPWTSEEKEIFMEKFIAFGKDFKKIASFLDHKTTADCIEFYYKNHKSDCFVKIKKKPELTSQGKSCSSNNYMVTSGKRWNRDTNMASLDMLGAASAIAINAYADMENEKKLTASDDGILERSGSLNMLNNDREALAADVLAGICGSLSSEAVSSCITSSFDLGESYQDWKCQKVGSSSAWPLTPEVTQKVDDETCSDESCGEMDPTDWTDEEKSIFVQAVSSYGKDFTMISRCVKTRSRDQCRLFFSKARKCLGLDTIHLRPDNDERPESDDANGGGSDNEDACVLETGSVICSEKSGSKIDEDIVLSDSNTYHRQCNPGESQRMLAGLNRTDETNGTGEIDCNDPELQLENIGTANLQVEDKRDLDIGGDNKMENAVANMSMATLSLENSASPHVEAGGNEVTGRDLSLQESMSTGGANDQNLPVSGEDETIPVGRGEQPLASVNILCHELGENEDVNTVGLTDLNCSDHDLHENGITSCPSAELNASVGYDPKQGQKISRELNPPLEPQAISLEHDSSLVKLNSVKGLPASLYKNTLKPDMLSVLNFDKIDKPSEKSSSTNDCDKYLCSNSLLEAVDTCQILRGHPLKMSTEREMNRDISSKTLASQQSFMKVDGNFHSNMPTSPEWLLQKCKNSKDEKSVAGLSFLTQAQKHDHSSLPLRSSSEAEKPSRNGNVKLFGQILSHPSSQERRNSSTSHEEDKDPQYLCSRIKNFSLNFASSVSVDGSSVPVKRDGNNSTSIGVENVPLRSYGFWDGNRIRTGFSTLPDSAILLAKYPDAFSNYSSGAKMEQQPLHSVFPAREISRSNGGVDYPFYVKGNDARVQPFTIDFKQQQDMLFSETQRRNGFDAVSSLQEQARGLVGINVGGRGGILIEGVSDPVAAIKMQYAKTEQYGGQTSSIIREEEAWKGKGDIGR